MTGAQQPCGVSPRRLSGSAQAEGHRASSARRRGVTMGHRAEVLTIARAEALFASDVSAGTPLSRAEATAAIRRAMRAHRGTRGCAAALATSYGERPETAAPRMRWARSVVESLFRATEA